MATHPLKEWRSILVAVFILGIIAGANFWGNVSADSHGGAGAGAGGPGRSAEARTIHPPQNPVDRDVIQVEGGAVDVTGGVSVGENVPGAAPGTPSQPVPNFSAINTPVWVSSQGPAQIVDDLVIYGLTEVKGGLINNGGVAPPPGGGGGGVPPASMPDLSVISLAISPINPQAGQTVTLFGIIKNTGNAEAGTSMARLTLVGVDPPIDVPTVNLLEDSTQYISQLINWPATLGAHTFRICADVNAAVTESNEGNNCSEQSFTVVAAAPLPPVIVFDRASYTVVSRGTTVATVTLNADAANQDGNRIEVAAVTISSNNSSIAAPLAETGTDTGIFTASINLGLANSPAINTDLLVNCSTDVLRAQYPTTAPQTTSAATVATPSCIPDLIIDLPPTITPATPQVGNPVSFSAPVKNQGLANSNASSTILKIDGITIATNATGGLAINAVESESWTWTATQGNHAVEVCADVNRTVGELDEDNNCTSRTFMVAAAPTSTLTLTRVNTPAANSALPTGSNVTLLEFDAQMNTGTVSMNRLYIVPTTGRSGRITNLKLINTSTSPETILDPITDDASVRGHSDAYVFIPETTPLASTGTPIPTPSIIGTTPIRLKITGTVTCGNGNVEDYIIEHADDVFLVNPPANIVKQTLPFTAVSRTATACPPPAAPTVATTCSGGNSAVTLAWTNPDNKGRNGYNIDIDQVNTSANAFLNKAGANDFLNTDTIPTNTTSTIVPTTTPLKYYDMTGETRGAQSIPLTPGAKYFARIYYRAVNEHSQLASFAATACAAGGAAAGAAGAAAGAGGARFTPPPAGRGAGTVRNSILNFDNETFPYSLAAEQNEPVTLFGAFIPQANAGWFVETANAQAAPAALHPVYVFDDLYVYGNGATGPEPGNLFVRGGIVTEGNSNIGSVGGVTQFTGNVQVTGGMLSVGMLNVSGNLMVSRDIETSGSIKAIAVGGFYRKEGASNRYSGNEVSASVSCETGDILISCSGDSELPSGSAYKYYGAKAATNGTQCTARGGRLSSANTNTITINVQGVCFSPNGLPAGQTNIPVP